MRIVVPMLRQSLLVCAAALPLAGLAAATASAQSYGQPYTKAADTSLRPIDHSPRQVLPIYHPPIWEGLYLGGHVGGDFGSLRPSAATNEKPDIRGIAAGLHVGYNWHVNNFVAGFEFDGNAKSTEGYRTFAGPLRVDASQDWLTSLRLRLGFAAGGTLLYVTGGYAVGNVDLGLSAPAVAVRANEVMQGYVLGGGIEWKFSPNVSARIEGLHYNFAEKQFSFPIGTVRGDGELTTIRAGLTYHFN